MNIKNQFLSTSKPLGHEDAATMENRLSGSNAFCGVWRKETKLAKDKLNNQFNQSESRFVVSQNIETIETQEKIHNQPAIQDKIVYAKGDSVASSHYWCEEDKHILSHVKDILGPTVLLPNK